MTALVELAVVQMRVDRLFKNRLWVVDSDSAEAFDLSWKTTSIQKQNEYNRFLRVRAFRKYSDPEISRLGDTVVLLDRVYRVFFGLLAVGLTAYWVSPAFL